MWNCQIHGLLGGTTICLFDGSPAGPSGAADWSTLWRFAAETGVTFFGAGAAFYASCLKAGVEPMRHGDLSRAARRRRDRLAAGDRVLPLGLGPPAEGRAARTSG